MLLLLHDSGVIGKVYIKIQNVDIHCNLSRPGVLYQFEVTTQSNNIRSKTVQAAIRTQPLCTSELIIINKQEVGYSWNILL